MKHYAAGLMLALSLSAGAQEYKSFQLGHDVVPDNEEANTDKPDYAVVCNHKGNNVKCTSIGEGLYGGDIISIAGKIDGSVTKVRLRDETGKTYIITPMPGRAKRIFVPTYWKPRDYFEGQSDDMIARQIFSNMRQQDRKRRQMNR